MLRLVSVAKYWNYEPWISENQIFAKKDLKSPYNLIEIDEKFKEITIMYTSIRWLEWIHLPFDINISSKVFQKANEKFLSEKIKDIIYLYDIYVGASRKEEWKHKTKQILKKWNEASLIISKNNIYDIKYQRMEYHSMGDKLNINRNVHSKKQKGIRIVWGINNFL